MVTRFDLSKDNHIDLLYLLHRQFWALAKDFSFAGMTTTGRLESINKFIYKKMTERQNESNRFYKSS
jgi:hypothetical protein